MAARERILAAASARRRRGFTLAWDLRHGAGGSTALADGTRMHSPHLALMAARLIDPEILEGRGRTTIQELSIAGALIAAEVDRLTGGLTDETVTLERIEARADEIRDRVTQAGLGIRGIREAAYSYAHTTEKTARWPGRLERVTPRSRLDELALAGALVYLELERRGA